MASIRRTQNLPRPGFQPAFGQVDPTDDRGQDVKLSPVTHYPANNATVCGMRPVPTSAADYDPDDPTCPACADWVKKTRAATERAHGATILAAQEHAKVTREVDRAASSPRKGTDPKPEG